MTDSDVPPVAPPTAAEEKASKLAWKKGLCVPRNKKEINMPSPRSGHSFTVGEYSFQLFMVNPGGMDKQLQG